MKFVFAPKPKPGTAVIVPVFFQKKKFIPTKSAVFDQLVGKAVQDKVFEGGAGEIYSQAKIHLAALGDPKKCKQTKILSALGNAVKTAKKEKGNILSLHVPKEFEAHGEFVAEAITLGNYDPAQFKTGKEAKKIKEHDFQTCVLTGPGAQSKVFQKAVSKGSEIGNATNYVRDLVNSPPNIANPKFLEEEAKKLAKDFGYKLTVMKNAELKKLGMNAILAVNRGSKEEARLIILEYWPKETSCADKLIDKNADLGLRPDPHKAKPIVLAGKGVTFDSGGYNLKPSGYIENMHLDMAGAASVLGVFKLLKKMDVKFPVIGIAAITENCIGGDAYKPSEIIKTYSGKTVEITNTDAEGRMVLCDALAYADKTYKPRYLIDIATLTGSCMVALGERYAGLFGNDKNLMKLIRKAGNETDELVWPLPLHPDFVQSVKGEITDLKNAEDQPRYAGASKGAIFLKQFIGKSKWVHLDIAGPAYVNQPKKYESKRATGYGVRLMMKLFEYL